MWLKRRLGASEPAVEQLGKLESEVMDRVWQRGEVSVRDLHAEIAPRLAYTTVMTTLDRLFKKGILARRQAGRAFLYRAKLTKEQYNQQLTSYLLGIAAEEAGSRTAILSCFVDYVGSAEHRLLDELDELIKARKKTLRGRS
jgi:predicted transcriptional regulator